MMYPHERSLVAQLSDKPFALIGVNSDDVETARQVVKEKNLNWRSFQNSQEYGEISTAWNVRGWPTIYIIDHEGKIRYENLRGPKLDRAIEELLGEMGHEVEISHGEEKEKPAKKPKAGDEGGSGDADSETEKGSAQSE